MKKKIKSIICKFLRIYINIINVIIQKNKLRKYKNV